MAKLQKMFFFVLIPCVAFGVETVCTAAFGRGTTAARPSIHARDFYSSFFLSIVQLDNGHFSHYLKPPATILPLTF